MNIPLLPHILSFLNVSSHASLLCVDKHVNRCLDTEYMWKRHLKYVKTQRKSPRKKPKGVTYKSLAVIGYTLQRYTILSILREAPTHGAFKQLMKQLAWLCHPKELQRSLWLYVHMKGTCPYMMVARTYLNILDVQHRSISNLRICA